MGFNIPRAHTDVEAVHHAHTYRHEKRCDYEMIIDSNIANVNGATIEPSVHQESAQVDKSSLRKSEETYLSDTAIVDSDSSVIVVNKTISCREPFSAVIRAILRHSKDNETWGKFLKTCTCGCHPHRF